MKKKIVFCLIAAMFTGSTQVLAGWGLKDLDPFNRNSGIRKTVEGFKDPSDFDPFNRNSAIRDMARALDRERLNIFDKWLSPAA